MSAVEWGTVPDWITAGAALAATAFGAVTVLQIRRDASRGRRQSLEGVAASWRAVAVPAGAEEDGTAVWDYVFEVENPGGLPITHVRLAVSLALDVQRVHYNGRVDPPTRLLQLDTPVVGAGRSREWNRQLRMDYWSASSELRKTKVVVDFVDPDEHDRQTVWPKRRAALGNGPKAG